IMSVQELHKNDGDMKEILLNRQSDILCNGQTEKDVGEPLLSKIITTSAQTKNRRPRKLEIVDRPIESVIGQCNPYEVSFAGVMPRTPHTPSTIFNFELAHSPGLQDSPVYVEAHPRTFSFKRITAPSTVEEISAESEVASKKQFVHCDSPTTNWKSIWIMGIILFLVKMQFAVYYSSIWPFLQEVDSSATAIFYGFMTASYSLGAALSAPIFGYFSNKMRQIKIPAIIGLFIVFLSNSCFMLIELIPKNRKYFLLIARLGHGIGIGASILLQTYSAIASSEKDKSTAAAISDGAYCLGIAFGPVFQLIFSPLGYPGIAIGPFILNMYTASAFTANAMIVLALLFIIFVFSEQYNHIVNEEKFDKNISHALPNYDRTAIALCIFIKFVQMFIYANFETIGSPYSMIVFKWTRSQTARYNSALVSATGILGFAFLAFYVWTKIGRRLDNRIGLLAGFILCLMFHICTYPWKLYDNKISYREEISNAPLGNIASESVGCPPSFKWCGSTPAINVYVYNTLYVFLFVNSSMDMVLKLFG
uniref:Major facilitator superfamily (MFS) profile domain-containing protein n=1 Tax=Parascaris univalens TaxID=6257 RepID=A0A915B8N9_PARUN